MSSCPRSTRPPKISVFVATPSVLAVGTNLTFVVSLSHGSPPFAYRYEGLPPGCGSVDQPTLTCTPSEAGRYNVSVAVSTATGANASASTDVIIRGAPSGPAAPSDIFGTPVGEGIAFVAGAVLVAVLFESYRRRRQVRREGDEIVRALSGADAQGAHEPDRP